MNMKQLKQTAPVLFSKTYVSHCFSHEELIQQLRAAGMPSAAWAVEDLLEAAVGAEGVEELREEVEVLEAQTADMRDELDRYKGFFMDIVSAFERAHNGGSWPWARPDDEGLIQAISGLIERETEEEHVD